MGVIYNQPSGGEQLTTAGKKMRTLVTKGLYADQLAATASRPRGTHIDGYGYVLSWSLERLPGDAGMTTYHLAAVTAEQWASNAPISETWSLKYMRVDIPIQRYGGESEGASANLYDLARWQSEPDRNLWVAYQYRTDPNGGAIVTLSEPTQKLAKKIKMGYQSVQRHHPIAILRQIYANEPSSGIGDNIDFINTPAKFASAAAAWLKSQDDIDQQADGNWVRNQMWQGADVWDVNFYGSSPDRWAFGSI